jgi:hypothetical protein
LLLGLLDGYVPCWTPDVPSRRLPETYTTVISCGSQNGPRQSISAPNFRG